MCHYIQVCVANLSTIIKNNKHGTIVFAGKTLFMNCVVPEDIHTPTPYGGQNSKERGVQKEVISEDLVGCLPLLTKVFFRSSE